MKTEEIIRLRENGLTYKEIAQRLGISTISIYRVMKGKTKNIRRVKNKKKPHLIYASYTLKGQECLVEWIISERNKSAAMNRAMDRMGLMGGENRKIDAVYEMTPEFRKREKQMSRHRELHEDEGESHG